MGPDRPVRLGDLVTPAQINHPEEYGIVVSLGAEIAEVMWSWGTVECSYTNFGTEKWGQLRVLSS